MSILRTIDTYRRENSEFGDPIANALFAVSDDVDLDEVVMYSGSRSQSYRDLLQGVIDADPDSIFLTVDFSDAVTSLYGQPRRNRRNSPPKIYSFLKKAYQATLGKLSLT